MRGMELPQFDLKPVGGVSALFIKYGIHDFHSALTYVGRIPYGRNSNKIDFKLVLSENVGTCSTKHALLVQLCKEHGVNKIRLFTGIYEMNEKNTPGVGKVLESYGLISIPEAHCYLLYENNRYDFTRIDFEAEPITNFVVEMELTPDEIGTVKTDFHRNYIPRWTREKGIKYETDSIWKIREECIAALSNAE